MCSKGLSARLAASLQTGLLSPLHNYVYPEKQHQCGALGSCNLMQTPAHLWWSIIQALPPDSAEVAIRCNQQLAGDAHWLLLTCVATGSARSAARLAGGRLEVCCDCACCIICFIPVQGTNRQPLHDGSRLANWTAVHSPAFKHVQIMQASFMGCNASLLQPSQTTGLKYWQRLEDWWVGLHKAHLSNSMPVCMATESGNVSASCLCKSDQPSRQGVLHTKKKACFEMGMQDAC